MSHKDQADGRDERGRNASPPENNLHKRAPGSAVPIRERVNGLELGVCDRRLQEPGQSLVVAECAEIVHQPLDFLGWRRNVVRAAGVIVVSPDPVLRVTELATPPRGWVLAEKRSLHRPDALGLDFFGAGRCFNGKIHRIDVGEDVRRLRTDMPAGLSARFSACQRSGVELHPFDFRGGDGFSAQQQPGKGRERRSGGAVQFRYGLLGVGQDADDVPG